MARMKDHLFADPPAAGVEEIAARLLGEIDGRYILCPSPGKPPDDRSMSVRVNPDNLSMFFVYYCEGPLSTAHAYIKRALGITEFKSKHINDLYAQRLWDEAVPGVGTSVETYLRSRGIKLPVPVALRCHPSLKHSSGSKWPGMVAGVFDSAGKLCAVHRTFLRHDGRGKAPVDPDKMTLGPIGGHAIHLRAHGPSLILAEGIETALSVMQTRRLPAWSPMSAVGLKTVTLPPAVRHVIIAADGDDVGRRAARAAMRRFLREGRTIAIAHAPEGADFNDVLLGGQR